MRGGHGNEGGREGYLTSLKPRMANTTIIHGCNPVDCLHQSHKCLTAAPQHILDGERTAVVLLCHSRLLRCERLSVHGSDGLVKLVSQFIQLHQISKIQLDTMRKNGWHQRKDAQSNGEEDEGKHCRSSAEARV